LQIYFYILKNKIMKKILSGLFIAALLYSTGLMAQDLKKSNVPATVQTAFAKKYAEAKKVSWEKEKGNYEANWGGKSGEDNSASFTPAGEFIEIVVAMPVAQLPKSIVPYVKGHYNGASINEAGKVTDSKGKVSFEAEIKGKDLIFDESGSFVKED
jgi:hypothetical protein